MSEGHACCKHSVKFPLNLYILCKYYWEQPCSVLLITTQGLPVEYQEKFSDFETLVDF